MRIKERQRKVSKKMRIGVVNWDCSLPPETYFGYYQTRTLSPVKYRNVTPYYADILGENKITYHKRGQAEYDRELAYAIKAGIDYFAYVFYPEEGSKNHISLQYTDCSHRVYELNYARRMHESSRLRQKIGMAAIVAKHPFTHTDVKELVALLAQPYYEQIDGRPLVYLFKEIKESLLADIRGECRARGIAEPYFAVMFDRNIPDDVNYQAVDAISAYGCVKSGIHTYEELCEELRRNNEERLSKKQAIIPLFTTGWDPSPRVDIPSPWVTYSNLSYAKAATAEELVRGAQQLAQWIKATAADAFVGHIMTFAWNEFEEGGWICPTYRGDGSINDERIAAFAKIVELWKDLL